MELDKVELIGVSVRSMEINDIRSLSDEFSTGSRKMGDFRRHPRECLEGQKNQRQTE